MVEFEHFLTWWLLWSFKYWFRICFERGFATEPLFNLNSGHSQSFLVARKVVSVCYLLILTTRHSVQYMSVKSGSNSGGKRVVSHRRTLTVTDEVINCHRVCLNGGKTTTRKVWLPCTARDLYLSWSQTHCHCDIVTFCFPPRFASPSQRPGSELA